MNLLVEIFSCRVHNWKFNYQRVTIEFINEIGDYHSFYHEMIIIIIITWHANQNH